MGSAGKSRLTQTSASAWNLMAPFCTLFRGKCQERYAVKEHGKICYSSHPRLPDTPRDQEHLLVALRVSLPPLKVNVWVTVTVKFH